MRQRKSYRLVPLAIAPMAMPHATALAAGASEPGLPQLDIATWPSQLFWLVVLFAAGYVVMAKIVTPRIGTVLEERRQTLEGDLDKARNASAEATTIREKYEADLNKARGEAADVAREAAAEANKKAEAAEAKTAKKLAEKVAKAEAKLAEAKNSALANLNEVAAAAAIEAVSQVAGLTATAAQAGKTAGKIAASMAKQEAN
ncbi:MAG: F0F1 ATP synthase subunit B' [Candidatus Puniceispirillum sp.]